MTTRHGESGAAGDSSATLAVEPEPGDQLGRYVVEHFVARGGMATVYAARDTATGQTVALKLLSPLGPDRGARGRFRREFRALSRLEHPNVLRVFEWGLHRDRPWFSMELVEGSDLYDEVDAWAELPAQERYSRAQGVFTQLVRALDYIHDRGLVHRDLTPGNVMVQPDGTVTLMDFGVVRELGSELTGVHEVMGTAAWIAPEQILGGAVDARADLYSLGAVLYLMLTGRRPFTARSLQGWLDKHLHEVPRPPREVDPRVPEALDAICVRLLAKDPADRFASAAHLLHVLGDVDPVDDSEHWPPRLVGRTVLRARIRSLLGELEQNQKGGAVLVQGAPGQGKTRILDMAESQARRRGLRVVRSRARADDGPFGTFVGVLVALQVPVDRVPEVVRAALLGEGDLARERYPVMAAFKPLLSEAAPLVVILDDLHVADGASLDLLVYLIRNTLELAAESMLFVLSEEVPEDGTSTIAARLEATGVTHREWLGPLEPSEVEELMASLVVRGQAAAPLAQRLHAESDGSPAFLVDMLRGLVDEGLLVRDGTRWRITLDPAQLTDSRLPMPASLRQALQDRLAPLSADALEVGRCLAVLRRSMELDTLFAVAAIDEDAVMEALDELSEAGIVHESRTDSTDRVELSHERFRDVLVDGIPPAERRVRHQRTGEVLERLYRHRPGLVAEDLTYHFDQAGLASKAYSYLLRTAKRRLDASLWDEALEILSRAKAMESSARQNLLLDDADRALAEVHLGRSQCLLALGNWEEAEADARAAAELARAVADPILESRVLVEVGRQLRQRGEVDKASPWLDEALERATAAHDPALRTTPLYELGALAWAKGNLKEAERLWRGSLETAQRVADDRAVGFGFNGLGVLAVCTGQTIEARKHLEQSTRLFEQLGMLAPLSIARMNLAELYHSTGLLKKALSLADRTVAQAREVNHPIGIALGLAHRARLLTELARGDEAQQNAEAAVRLTVEVKSTEDEVLARATLARVHLDRGQPQAALAVLDQLVPLLRQYDIEGVASQVHAWRATALAMLAREVEAEAELELAATFTPEWPLVKVRTDLAFSEALRALGRRDQARERLHRALQASEAHGYRMYQLAAHDGLSEVVVDEVTRARHSRVASALARSLAANLPRDDAARFLARGWGAP